MGDSHAPNGATFRSARSAEAPSSAPALPPVPACAIAGLRGSRPLGLAESAARRGDSPLIPCATGAKRGVNALARESTRSTADLRVASWKHSGSRGLHVAAGDWRDGGNVEVGQPTHESHPELLGPNDILPGVTASEFAARRRAVMARLPRGSVLVVGAAPVRYMAGIVPFPYRPDSDLIYLTGCWHPGVVAVIESDGGRGGVSGGSGAADGGSGGAGVGNSAAGGGSGGVSGEMGDGGGGGGGDVHFTLYSQPVVPSCHALFVHPPCSSLPSNRPQMVVWDGRALDPPAAAAFFKPDRALFTDSLNEYLLEAQQRIAAHRLSSSSSLPSSYSSDRSPPPRIYCDHRANRDLIATVPVLAAELATGRLLSSRSALDEQRWIKSEAEQRLMRRAAEITAEAFLTAMRHSAAVAVAGGRGGAGGGGGGPGFASTCEEDHMGGSLPHEGHISVLIEFECKRRGAQRFAYPPVVAGGSSGCIVHYLRNDKPVQPGEALLVDAGCEYFGYASDITRVWPPFGKFSSAQRAVYEAVREAMVECIAMCRPGATLRDIHQHSVISLSSALVQLGVCQGPAQQVARGAFRQFYPTSVGHWLGLDTHDCASVSSFEKLKPGVVLTIEPGLYLPDIDQVPKHLRGIGVRIEDDILVTADGYENLTAAVPADVDALEELMAEAKERLSA
ncbi:unnamed protein product [Closterium sp. Yama58-4]|nr:unnamed protein product [Closterium sp. Yama58-4]